MIAWFASTAVGTSAFGVANTVRNAAKEEKEQTIEKRVHAGGVHVVMVCEFSFDEIQSEGHRMEHNNSKWSMWDACMEEGEESSVLQRT